MKYMSTILSQWMTPYLPLGKAKGPRRWLSEQRKAWGVSPFYGVPTRLTGDGPNDSHVPFNPICSMPALR